MSGDVLRRAARLMRERAEAASAGPWTSQGGGFVMPPTPWSVGTTWRDAAIIHPNFANGGVQRANADAAHIASWHPAVALAVADWLDNTAYWLTCDECNASKDRCTEARQAGKRACCPDCSHARAATSVARAYLGADQ
jgi:hypothetical protein